MTHPIKVSQEEFKVSPGVRWNAMIHICAHSNILELTPAQRVAHLAFWYMSEVYNGGHYQYFVNQRAFNHREVVKALQTIGASEQASILSNVLQAVGAEPMDMPKNVEKYLANQETADLSAFDTQFYSCQRSIETCLQDHLNKHEAEFVEWIT